MVDLFFLSLSFSLSSLAPRRSEEEDEVSPTMGQGRGTAPRLRWRALVGGEVSKEGDPEFEEASPASSAHSPDPPVTPFCFPFPVLRDNTEGPSTLISRSRSWGGEAGEAGEAGEGGRGSFWFVR